MTEAGTGTEAVVRRITEMGGFNTEDPGAIEDLRDFVSALHPETVALLGEELRREGGEHLHSAVIDIVFYQHASMRAREARLREFMLLVDRSERSDPDMNLALVEGLHCIPKLQQHTDITRGDERNTAACRALVKVTREAVKVEPEHGRRVHSQEGVVFLTDPALTSLVVANPERADEIVAFVRERRSLDPREIAQALEVLPPLQPGTL